MTPEIKQRIEQIRRGEVPEGYKKTKVGIVPCEWEEINVGKCISEYVEKTTVENQYPILTSARTGLMLQSQYYSNNQVTTNDNIGYNVIPRGFVTYRSRSDDGRFRFNENQIIDKGIISYFYPVFSFKANVSHSFMLSLLNHTIYRQSYSFVEGTAQQVLSFKKLSSLKYCLPSLYEQQKIADILSAQDKLIELQEKKIKHLQQFKKECLKNMFPKKGERAPLWRFPQFTNDWKLSEFGKLFKENSHKNCAELPPLTIIQGKGTVLRDECNRNLIYDKDGLKNYKLVNKGDFIVHLRSFEGGLEVANSRGIVSPAYHIFCGDKVYTDFYYPFFRSEYFIKGLLKPHIYGIRDGKSIDIDGMKKIKIPNPEIEEQIAVGSYFAKLDNLINLNKCNLDEIKKQKEALMQLLLTGIVRVK